MTKFEDEKSLLIAEHKDKLRAQATQLVNLMKDMGVNIGSGKKDQDDSANDGDETKDEEFVELISACKVAF